MEALFGSALVAKTLYILCLSLETYVLGMGVSIVDFYSHRRASAIFHTAAQYDELHYFPALLELHF